MSQAIHHETDLRSFLVERRDVFETLADHDDDEIAELFGVVPLELIEILPEESEE